MAAKELVTKVWIEEGCIVCDACETAAEDVFEVLEETCIIRPAALDAEFTKPRSLNIIDAAEECPVDVIKFDTVTVEVADEPEAPAEAGAEKAAVEPAKSSETPAPVTADAATKTAEKAPDAKPVVAATAQDADPTIAALLKATTSRGGAAGIERKNIVVPEEVAQWQRVSPEKLPPDIRHARAMEAAARAGAEAKAEDKKKDPNRRSAVSAIAMGCGWACFSGATAIGVGPAFTRFLMPNVLEEPDPRVRVGPKDKYAEMPINSVNEDYKPQGVWMIRQEGQIAALNIICTHLGCIPNWLPNDFKFKCPCHGSGFKPTGMNFEGPAPRPLERFKITEVDGQIIVDKSKKFQQERGEWANPDSFVTV